MKDESKNIVVKLGTNVLTDSNGQLDTSVIQRIVDQVASLKKEGNKVIIVSSGAVGAGKSIYQLSNVKDEIIQRQVYSSIGQVQLMNLYAEYFKHYNLVCAQVLATKEDFLGKEHYKNMKNCLKGLLKDDIIPIINENDVVSLKELMFTDNDELAGLTAYLIKADILVILTSVDGLFTGDPSDDASELINEVHLGDDSHKRFITENKSTQGRGGMLTKFDTASRMAGKGIVTYLANGKKENILSAIVQGKQVGTCFHIAEATN